MKFRQCIEESPSILMEGALGERLKREFGLKLDPNVVMSGLIYSEEGRTALKRIWQEYLQIAEKYNLPFLATTPTRRTNYERVEKSVYNSSIIKDNVDFLREIQKQSRVPMYIGGLLGSKGDAYTGEGALSVEDAMKFHDWEIKLFAEAGVDYFFAGIIPTITEAAGLSLSIQNYDIPYIISFTIQADGCLIDGTTINEAIKYIDEITSIPPVCYMSNCVHPQILYKALQQPFNNNAMVHKRFLGLQANTSPLSYAELDNAVDLKSSEPVQLANDMIGLRDISPIKIFGGCCGTDGRHMEEIAKRISL